MDTTTQDTLSTLRAAVAGSEYDGKLYLVGGFVRDAVMGLTSASDDIDIVLEGDAPALAQFLYEKGVTDHFPVTFPRFGTAMIGVGGRDVELVTARTESYADNSRKPDTVQPATLLDDAKRRDFTINTLLQSLATGEIVDPLGSARADMDAQIIRTPTDPQLTFADDPLRMLRAIRFAARFGFQIAPLTWKAIRQNAGRLSIISAERIRDEFSKTLLTTRPVLGLTLLKDSGLLEQFAPELLTMVGVTQNEFHAFAVWEHTLEAVQSLPADASLTLKLATLLHDIGKPPTKATADDGRVHFYAHADVGAQIARKLLTRLKFPNDEVDAVTHLVAQHMRIGEYKPAWSDGAVRRLARDAQGHLDDLFHLHAADVSALAPEHRDISRAGQLRERLGSLQAQSDIASLTSPLSGQEIMRLLNIPAGRRVGEVKEFLLSKVLDGELAPHDTDAAQRLALAFAKRVK